MAETLFGWLKGEHLLGMRFDTRHRAKDKAIDWLGFDNRKRVHSTLGYTGPMAFEETQRRRHSARAAQSLWLREASRAGEVAAPS